MLWLIIGLVVGFIVGVLFGRKNKVKVESVMVIVNNPALTPDQKIKALIALFM